LTLRRERATVFFKSSLSLLLSCRKKGCILDRRRLTSIVKVSKKLVMKLQFDVTLILILKSDFKLKELLEKKQRRCTVILLISFNCFAEKSRPAYKF